MIKRVIRIIGEYIRMINFNRKGKVCLSSRYASIEAKYGTGVSVGKGCYIDRDVAIGDYTYVNKNTSLENCNIGKYCSISSGVYINPYEHDYTMLTTHPVIRHGRSDNSRPKVNIGNDVLISLNVIILKGVTVGDGAIIGAGSVVTSDVKPYEIVGGVPAKHIKWRFKKEKIDLLEKITWWNWEREKILKNIKFLRNETDEIY